MLLQLGPERPLYRALTIALREAILTGTLAPGSRLPGTRALARELGVSRVVALAAFEQLAAEGYIVSLVGSGTRVALSDATFRRRAAVKTQAEGRLTGYAARSLALNSQAAPANVVAAPRSAIDFRYGTFVPEESTRRAWVRAVARSARAASFEYPDPAGLETLRVELCRHLHRHRGIEAKPEDVLVVTGSQQALDLTARAICEEGVRIGIEDPHYQGARRAFLAAGARIVACPIYNEALDVERHVARLAGVRAIYVTPSHQFPTGAVMNFEQRRNLLRWAGENAAWIIEDDYDSEFHYGTGTIPALRGLDEAGHVIYVGTFARTLSPELRLGFVVVPSTLRDTFRAIKWLADRGSSPLEQRALASLMESGAYERAQRRMARSLADRRRRLLAALRAQFAGDGISWSGSGAHLFLRFANLSADDVEPLLAEAVKRDVRLYSANAFHLLPPQSATLMCGFAALTAGEIERGVERFAAAYRSFAS